MAKNKRTSSNPPCTRCPLGVLQHLATASQGGVNTREDVPWSGAILWPLGIGYDHDLHEFHVSHVFVRGGIDMGHEAIGAGELVVDFAFEE